MDIKTFVIMDYEKLYKDALERARDLMTKQNPPAFNKDLISLVFPELAESKDERIRKELIEHIKANYEADYVLFKKFSPDDVIAWLEKQKERSTEPEWCHHKVDLSNCSEEYRKAYYDGWNNCNMQHSQCGTESNDEDEKIRKALKQGFFEYGKSFTKFGGIKVGDIIAWLEKHDANKEYVFRPLAGTMIENAVEQALEQGDVVLAFNGFYTPVKGKTSEEILTEYDNWLEKQGKRLDADKVIDWLKTKVYDDSTFGMAMIDQFKKDFGL